MISGMNMLLEDMIIVLSFRNMFLSVGSTQVPFLMCTLERNTTKIAAQVLALNFCYSALLLSFSQTLSFSCIFVFASSFICMDLSIVQTQHP